jgi:tyrosinase
MAPNVTTTEVALRQPQGPARRTTALDAAGGRRRFFLNLENITGQGAPTNYSVYLNVPPGEDPTQHADLFVGSMPTFGVAEASSAQHPHGGSGLTHVLDITAVVNRLIAQGAWNAGNVRVSFLERKPLKAGAQVQVGRVSVYYQPG